MSSADQGPHPDHNQKEAREEFNDEFLVAPSQHSKRLVELRFNEFESDEHPSKPPTRIRDTGLVALAGLPHLFWIQTDAPQASAKGVLALMLKSPHARDRRHYTLTFGESRNREARAFFNLLCDLLEKLVALPPESLRKSECDVERRLRIRKIVIAKHHGVVRARLESLVQQFVSRFPNCELIFSSSPSVARSRVPEDLTTISTMDIDTSGPR